jgi:predicted nucleic acid-binding protein
MAEPCAPWDALDWFRARGSSGFATCPLTQTGFVRISSNPAFTSKAVTPGEAIALLLRLTAMPGHRFWPDDLPLVEACPPDEPLAIHRLVTDAYLLAMAGIMTASWRRWIVVFARWPGDRRSGWNCSRGRKV